MEDSILTAILVATIVAGTPLIITALGELVTEKSGVLNLGAEGMMAVGRHRRVRRGASHGQRDARCARRAARPGP